MVILINNKKAVLKKNTSFDYISENSYFTGADSYTLSITFPLAGCPENIAIFGYLNRKDFDVESVLLDCEIHDLNFDAYGCVSIVDISETEVKTQFLEGQSAINYSCDFDDIYVNELQLFDVTMTCSKTPKEYLMSYTDQLDDTPGDGYVNDYVGMVCFPWVNNTSGNVQNAMHRLTKGGDLYFDSTNQQCVGQPYLMYVLERIFAYCGYTFDKSAFTYSQWWDCVVCNTLPLVWGHTEFAEALPHWTVTEFLEQWELVMDGKFHIDTKKKNVTFTFNKDTIAALPSYEITNVVDSFKVEMNKNSSSSSGSSSSFSSSSSSGSSSDNEYIEHRNLEFSDCSHQMWSYYSCPWLISTLNKKTWKNIAAMQSGLNSYLLCKGDLTDDNYKCIHYCSAEKLNVVLRVYKTDIHYAEMEDDDDRTGYYHYLRFLPVNRFGPYTLSDNVDGEVTECKVVPACIDYADSLSDLLFLECGTLEGDNTEDNDDQTYAMNVLNGGENDKQEEFFDKIYIGFWDGNTNRCSKLGLPHPIIDEYEFEADGDYSQTSYTCRLQGSTNQGDKRTVQYAVEQSKKYTFQFISDRIPNVQSIFYIHGKKYLAEKVQTSFSEDGMSKLMKIVCYRMKTPVQCKE